MRSSSVVEVGSGKTALVEYLCRQLREERSLAVVTNDIYTREDAEFLATGHVRVCYSHDQIATFESHAREVKHYGLELEILTGNAFATHDLEKAIVGTSLGVCQMLSLIHI